MRVFWLIAGYLFVGAGLIGIVLPLVPTTPFLLLAAFCFHRGSPRLHHWLLEHPWFGPPIHNWHQHRAITRKAKISAISAMAGLWLLSVVMQVPLWALLAQGGVLIIVAFFIWRQAEPPPPSSEQVDQPDSPARKD